MIEVTMVGPFSALTRFMLDAELLGAALHDLQVTPAQQPSASAGFLDISLSVKLPTRGVVAGHHADAVAAAIASQERSPFDPEAGAGPNEKDLSRQHRLTGLTTAGSTRYATIDGRDYGVGDTLQDMTVTSLREDAVLLSRGSGHFVIRFLPRPGG